VKVVVLTTSYPRSPEDVVGRFVADAVEHVCARGVTVEVVSPLDFHHFGIAYGYGVMGNLRGGRGSRRRCRRCSSPLRSPPAGRPATPTSSTRTGCPPVRSLRRPASHSSCSCGGPTSSSRAGGPALARAVLRRARLAICASNELAGAARELGAQAVRVIPSGVELPATIAQPEEPPHVLYAGRLSAEKGVEQLADAARGLPLVVAGDGPLRDRVPRTLGWVAHDELLRLYERSAVVVCPSLREGFGVSCVEAMAHARPVVASAVGGLRDLVVDGETGLLVPPGDVAALRAALERLLGTPSSAAGSAPPPAPELPSTSPGRARCR
jgi:glycosyltransferase involved in cell wall biosynthesis